MLKLEVSETADDEQILRTIYQILNKYLHVPYSITGTIDATDPGELDD